MSETKRTPTAITNALRSAEFDKLTDLLAKAGCDVLITKGAQLAYPVVDEVGGERFVRISLEIPKGDREGNAYDGYALAEIFTAEQARKQADKAKREEERLAKAAKKAQATG